MAMVVVGFAMLFNDLGTSSSIIQKEDPAQELLGRDGEQALYESADRLWKKAAGLG